MSNTSVYDIVTERIVAQLEQGVAPWRKPWKATGPNSTAPRNIDGYRYRGINVWLLLTEAMDRGYSSPYWMTFKQAKAKGGSVRKGEKSTVIVFWKRIRVTEKQEDGSVETKIIPMLKYFRVFNLDQTEGVKLPRKVLEEQLAAAASGQNAPDPIAEADEIAAGYILRSGPTVRHEDQDRAFYQPLLDVVTVPPLANYDQADEYYATLFHELGHSTGHKDRLNRTYGQAFGDHEYGREELVAEMTSAFLAAEAGIETTQDNNASYLAAWIRTLKEDNRAVVVAAGAAQRAADLILGRQFAADETVTESAEPAEMAA